MLKVEPEMEERLRKVAERHGQPTEAMLRKALEEFFAKQETAGERHPSGEPWPRRNPVGGVITPV